MKLILKQWWFWVIVSLVAIGVIISTINEEKEVSQEEEVKPVSAEKVKEESATKKEPKKEESTAEESIKPVFNVKEVANKSEEEVNNLLGQPNETETGKWTLLDTEEKVDYRMNYYKNGQIEIMFIEGKAVRVRLNISPEEYFKGEELNKNLAYVNLPIVELETNGLEGKLERGYKKDFEGFYEVEIGQWLEPDDEGDGFVKVVTEEKYR
jgi:hypothetical protein